MVTSVQGRMFSAHNVKSCCPLALVKYRWCFTAIILLLKESLAPFVHSEAVGSFLDSHVLNERTDDRGRFDATKCRPLLGSAALDGCVPHSR